MFAWHPNDETKAKKHYKSKIQKVISGAFSKCRKGKNEVDEYTMIEFVQPEHVSLILQKQRDDAKLAKQRATGKESARGKNKAPYIHHHGSEPSFKAYTKLESKRGETVPPTKFYIATQTSKKSGIIDPHALQFSESMEAALQARIAVDPVFASLPRAQQELLLWPTVQENSGDSGSEYRGLGSQVEFYQSEFSSSSTGRSSVCRGRGTDGEFSQQLEQLKTQVRAQAEESRRINDQLERTNEEARRAHEESMRTQQQILSLLSGSYGSMRPPYVGPSHPSGEDDTDDGPGPFDFAD